MAKNVIILKAEELKAPSALTPAAIDAYKFALERAGLLTDDGAVADFVEIRNLKAEGFRDLWELKSWCKKFIDSVEEVCKMAFNVGDEDKLPPNVSWTKQSYTSKWNAVGSSCAVVNELVEKGIMTLEEALCELSVDGVVRASGVDKERLKTMFPEDIVDEPKARSLKIK